MRTAVLVAGLAAQVSAAVVGALPWPLLAVTAVLYGVASRTAEGADERRARQLRHVGSGIALVGCGIVAFRLPSQVDPEAVRGTLGLMLVAAQVGQALGWHTVRDLRSGLTAAGGLLVLAASFSPDVLVGIPLLVGWVAGLVALARLQGSRQVVPAASVAVVLGLVAFLLVPVPAQAGLRSKLGGASAPAAERGGAGVRAFTGDELDLSQRGDLPADPVISVPAGSPVLWRSAAFDRYDGRTWTRPESRVLPGGPPYQVAAATGPTRTDQVQDRGPSDGTIWAPGLLVSVSVSGLGSRIPLVDELGAVQLPGLRGGYTAESQVVTDDPAQLRSRSGTDVEDARWRRLPVSLPDRVVQLGRQLTAGAGSRYDAAEAVAAWLRGHATYQLDSPVPERGEDAVDRFLFVDRRGFCEQFASAEVVLLRAVGIPARLVTGLAYGVPEGDRRLYRVADLHAWVELWVPGVGWVTSDPTAGVPLAEGASSLPLRQRLSGALTRGLRSLTALPGGRAGLALVLLLATALVAVLVSRRPVRRPAEVGPAVLGGPALQAFLRLDARLGARRRRPAESLRELESRLDPAVGRALRVVEQECYAPVPPDVRAAVEVLDRY